MLKKLCLAFVSMFFLVLLLEEISEAGRFGGGRSFGGRPSYQRSYSKPVSPQPGAGQGQLAPGQSPLGRRPFGGFGSMLGGMVMGSLIGSFLFGGGMQGSAGFGLLDFLVIGGGLLLLFRILKSRQPAAEFRGSGTGDSSLYDRGTSGWSGMPLPATDVSDTIPRIPPGFDEKEFLKGAEAGFNRLQESWYKRDLEDIRQFTSPEVWEEIASQAKEDHAPEKTEILLIKSRLLEVKVEGDDTVASVYFDVLMRESAQEDRPKQIKEVWHFSRKEKVPNSFWRLEGIQQLE